jgi:hypothetical protein
MSVKMGQADRRQYLAISGPTGSGNSALLMSLRQAVGANVRMGTIDPKGGLIRDLCERVPDEELDRFVLIDPSHREIPLGLNVLECPDPAPARSRVRCPVDHLPQDQSAVLAAAHRGRTPRIATYCDALSRTHDL